MRDLLGFFMAMIRGYYDGRVNGCDNNVYLGKRRFYYRRGYDRGIPKFEGIVARDKGRNNRRYHGVATRRGIGRNYLGT